MQRIGAKIYASNVLTKMFFLTCKDGGTQGATSTPTSASNSLGMWGHACKQRMKKQAVMATGCITTPLCPSNMAWPEKKADSVAYSDLTSGWLTLYTHSWSERVVTGWQLPGQRSMNDCQKSGPGTCRISAVCGERCVLYLHLDSAIQTNQYFSVSFKCGNYSQAICPPPWSF